jgi:hypothetical protein
MYSYNVPLSFEAEEMIADLIATYGNEIINLTHIIYDTMLGWYK